MGDRVRRAAIIFGSLLFIGVLWALSARLTLGLLLLACAPILIWKAGKAPERLTRSCTIACVAAVILAAIPVDIWVIRTGQVDAGVDEVIWGLVLPPPGESGSRTALAGGCAPPLLNPTRYALWVSY
jgi:hypothetical protein